MFSCFNHIKDFLWGETTEKTPVEVTNQPVVQIDSSCIGTEVVIVKQGRRICGAGGALSCAPIVQDKAYFEVKVQSAGIWCIGLATRKYDVQKDLGGSSESWALRNDGALIHNGQVIGNLSDPLDEGDTIGCTYDHVQLTFYLNGKPLNIPITGIRGTVYPAFYVDDGAILDVSFTNFQHSPPSGFTEILIEQDIL